MAITLPELRALIGISSSTLCDVTVLSAVDVWMVDVVTTAVVGVVDMDTVDPTFVVVVVGFITAVEVFMDVR